LEEAEIKEISYYEKHRAAGIKFWPFLVGKFMIAVDIYPILGKQFSWQWVSSGPASADEGSAFRSDQV
jgi:hypothetical protein